MDEFQLIVMRELINNPDSNLSAQQFEQFSIELLKSPNQLKNSKLAKRLYYKIAKSNLVRNCSTTIFMNNMN